MFFKEKRCSSCGAHYDDKLAFCPECHHENELSKENEKINKMCWLTVKDQLFNFLIGFLGLNIITVILSVIFSKTAQQNQTFALFIVNTLAYILVTILLIAYNFGNHLTKFLKPYFLKKDSYLYGILGAAVLLALSAICSIFADAMFPNAISGNQDSATTLVVNYPISSIIVLGILGPVVEEIAYRVGLFTLLSRTKIWIAYLVEATFFALLHFDFTGNLLLELANLPSYLCGGLVLSYIYQKRGPAASMSAHIINNLVSIFGIILAAKL